MSGMAVAWPGEESARHWHAWIARSCSGAWSGGFHATMRLLEATTFRRPTACWKPFSSNIRGMETHDDEWRRTRPFFPMCKNISRLHEDSARTHRAYALRRQRRYVQHRRDRLRRAPLPHSAARSYGRARQASLRGTDPGRSGTLRAPQPGRAGISCCINRSAAAGTVSLRGPMPKARHSGAAL